MTLRPGLRDADLCRRTWAQGVELRDGASADRRRRTGLEPRRSAGYNNRMWFKGVVFHCPDVSFG
jgi:hypothetical protein